MEISAAYLPQAIFAPSDRGDLPVPRVFIAPQRYIQGRGVLRGIGRYLSLMQAKRVALLMSERGSRNEGVQLLDEPARRRHRVRRPDLQRRVLARGDQRRTSRRWRTSGSTA